QGIVDFVRPGVAEIFALEPDLGATGLMRESVGAIHGGRPAAEGAREVFELVPKTVVLDGSVKRRRQLVDGGHQRLRDVLAAVIAIAPACIRRRLTHDRSTRRTASTKARNFA